MILCLHDLVIIVLFFSGTQIFSSDNVGFICRSLSPWLKMMEDKIVNGSVLNTPTTSNAESQQVIQDFRNRYQSFRSACIKQCMVSESGAATDDRKKDRVQYQRSSNQ